MKEGVTGYSLEAGLSDIDAYYNAGTIIGALQKISQDAGSHQAEAQTKQQKNSLNHQALQ